MRHSGTMLSGVSSPKCARATTWCSWIFDSTLPFSTEPHTRHGPVFSAAIIAHCLRDATLRRYGFLGIRAGFGCGRAGPSVGMFCLPVVAVMPHVLRVAVAVAPLVPAAAAVIQR